MSSASTGIMDIEVAKSELQSEREAYWAHLTDPKVKRRLQNRINKYLSRWKKYFYLDTAQDYTTLACEIKDMREGRARRREGRPRISKNYSQRRTSQRLTKKSRHQADNHQKLAAYSPEKDNLFDSTEMEFGFDQLNNTLYSEEDVNITTSHPSITSSGNVLAHSLSTGINRTPDIISRNFDFYNTQILSTDISDPASISGILHSGTNIPGNGWTKQDIYYEMNFDWPDCINEQEVTGIGQHWGGSNIFVPESHTPLIQPIIYDLVEFTSGIDGDDAGIPPSVASLPPETAGIGVQQSRLDEAQMYLLIKELKSQLHMRGKDTIEHPKNYGAEVDMRIAYLWNSLTAESEK